MNIDETYKNMAEDLKKMGIVASSNPNFSYNEILELSAQDIETAELKTVEEILERISSYNIYLKAQKGSLEAQALVVGAELTRLLYLETQKVDPKRGSVWLTREEKESVVLTENSQVNSLSSKIIKIRALLAKIKDVPYAIDKKLEILKMKYRRLCDQSRN